MEPVGNRSFCTPGHCIMRINPEFLDPPFEILANDPLGIKEAKRYWNSSTCLCECDPNYMNGKEQYRILKDYRREVDILAKEWEEKLRQRPGFFRDNYDKIKRLETLGKEIIEDLSSPTKKDFVAKFVEDHPNQAMTINAVCIASLAVFFLQRIIRR